jgi:hypothetical protein
MINTINVAINDNTSCPGLNTSFNIHLNLPDPDQYRNDCNMGGKAKELLNMSSGDDMKSAGVKLVRIGGINPDVNKPTNAQLIEMVLAVKAMGPGVEPLVQIPYWMGRYTIAEARDIVNLLKPYNVKYYSIGNEGNAKYFKNNTDHTSQKYNAIDIGLYIRDFSEAMKEEDSSIKIVGPDLTHYIHSFFQTLLAVPTGLPGDHSIAGKVPGKNYHYVDILAWHVYPKDLKYMETMAHHDAERSFLVGYPSGGFKTNIGQLKGLFGSINSHRDAPFEIGITEMNICYLNPKYPVGSLETDRIRNTIFGLGAASFFAGQWMAEMYGVAMAEGVSHMVPWSVHEGGGGRGERDLGVFDKAFGAQVPRSTYWHQWLMGKNFPGGTFHSYPQINNYKSFGYSKTNEDGIMIMNQQQNVTPGGGDAGANFSINISDG